MGDHRRARPGKPDAAPGISQLEAQQLRERVEILEKYIRDHLDEKNQWNSLVRDWVGSTVRVHIVTGESVSGQLLWTDRYTMCLRGLVYDPGQSQVARGETQVFIIHKGAITFLCQEVVPASA